MSLRRTVERNAAQGLLRLPTRIIETLAGGQHLCDGQILDPRVQLIIRVQELRKRPGLEELSPEEARGEYKSSIGLLDESPRPMRQVQDADVGGVPVRIYTPAADTLGGVLVYLHGGGGVIGDLDTCDAPARILADVAGVVIVSVDYRLAPEHPYPAALEDTLTVYRWAVEHAERLGAPPERVAIGGDSYGGTLAAIASLQLRDETAPAMQLLIYPCTDFLRQGGSRDLFAQGYLLDRTLIDWFRGHAFSSTEDRARASVSKVEDLSGAAPAIIYTAGFDPLRDEARDYSERLKAAGVRTVYHCETSLVHAFIAMTGVVPAARDALYEMGRHLKLGLER